MSNIRRPSLWATFAILAGLAGCGGGSSSLPGAAAPPATPPAASPPSAPPAAIQGVPTPDKVAVVTETNAS